MNGLRTRLQLDHLDPERQHTHNRVSHDADRDVFVGMVIIALILAALMAAGVVK